MISAAVPPAARASVRPFRAARRAGHAVAALPLRTRAVLVWAGALVLAGQMLAAALLPPTALRGAPLFAQGLDGDRIVICTANGLVVIDRKTGKPAAPAPGDGARDFCQFCLPCLQGGVAVPGTIALPLPRPDGVAVGFWAAAPFVRPRRAMGAAWPRAPPVPLSPRARIHHHQTEAAPMDSHPVQGRRAPPAVRMPFSGLRAVPSPLARAITATILVKLCVVAAMRVFLFDGAHRPVIDDSAMDRRLTAAQPAPHR